MLKQKIHKYRLYTFNNGYFDILKEIVKKNYEVLEYYKDDQRTYVVKIKVNNNIYILKKYYPRTLIKKIKQSLKKTESLQTLENVHVARQAGIFELAPCIGAIEEKKGFFITNQILIMKFCKGRRPVSENDYNKIIDVLLKINRIGRYHGDCNPGNFIFDENNNLNVIDTKVSKMFFGNYRQYFDFMVLKKYLPNNCNIDFLNKNIFYYFAYVVRKIRDFKNNENRGRG